MENLQSESGSSNHSEEGASGSITHHYSTDHDHDVKNIFELPSPIPPWPPGHGFATGSIKLGELEVCQVSTFTKVWSSHIGGGSNHNHLGAAFFKPTNLPDGFHMLGSYCRPNNSPLFGWVLAAKGDECLDLPLDYTLIWSTNNNTHNTKQLHDDGFFWLPVPPKGYHALGLVVTNTANKPSLDDIRCVRSDLTEEAKTDELIWSNGGIKLFTMKPSVVGVIGDVVQVGTYWAKVDHDPSLVIPSPACLKNYNKSKFDYMPNLAQIEAVMKLYSPLVYYHPDDPFLASSVSWFFENGALLYTRQGSSMTIEPDGSNLPQGGSADGEYWIDLPADLVVAERLKRGDLSSAKVYVHVKPMLGATFTDLAVWFFYPYNGAARAKLGLVNVPLGRLGDHVGDWEHITLRVSNFTGELWRVYFAEHNGGIWVDASRLEYYNENKFVLYSSFHGHASYPKPGLVLQGNTTLGIGLRNDMAKGDSKLNCGDRYEVVAAKYLCCVKEPPWLNYAGHWGPTVSYNIAKELEMVPGMVGLLDALPKEMLGEEGPVGPKMKSSWDGDEERPS